MRIEWSAVPEAIRAGTEDILGSRVVSATTQFGGFSHGLAARLTLQDESRLFMKAIPGDEWLAKFYRNEAATCAVLPAEAPAPRLKFTANIQGWCIVGFDDVEGHHPRLDVEKELAGTLAALEKAAQVLTPSPIADAPSMRDTHEPDFQGWRSLAENPVDDLDDWSLRHLDRLAESESTWQKFADGDTLLHCDVRPDNLLVKSDGSVVMVDWAWACQGAAWIDLGMFAPYLADSGVDPDPVLAAHPLTRGIAPDAVSSLVIALAGYWTLSCRKPALPQAPALRAHQKRCAQVTLGWLQRRLNWT